MNGAHTDDDRGVKGKPRSAFNAPPNKFFVCVLLLRQLAVDRVRALFPKTVRFCRRFRFDWGWKAGKPIYGDVSFAWSLGDSSAMRFVWWRGTQLDRRLENCLAVESGWIADPGLRCDTPSDHKSGSYARRESRRGGEIETAVYGLLVPPKKSSDFHFFDRSSSREKNGIVVIKAHS